MIKKILHMIPFVHFYSNWKTTGRADIVNTKTEGEIGKSIMQERVCEICGKVDIDIKSKYI